MENLNEFEPRADISAKWVKWDGLKVWIRVPHNPLLKVNPSSISKPWMWICLLDIGYICQTLISQSQTFLLVNICVMQNLRVEQTNSRPWTDEQMEALFSEGFPDFITSDQEVKKYISQVRDFFKAFDIVLVDEFENPVGTGWGVPINWTGSSVDLPNTFADVLRLSIETYQSHELPNTFVICGAVVHPEFKGSGVADDLIRALTDLAIGFGIKKVIAPIRPTLKHLHPLMGIEEYASWFREDGLPWDPWLRLHIRLGAQIIGLAPIAQTMTNSVEQWEKWANLKMPHSGQYIIENGMSPLHIDLEKNIGTYVEPNIWVRHK